MHVGSATRTYFNAGNPLLPLQTYTIEHRGYDNFMVVLTGSARTSTRHEHSRHRFQRHRQARAAFPGLRSSLSDRPCLRLADAIQGVNTPATNTRQSGPQLWSPRRPWVYGGDPSLSLARSCGVAARAYPRTKISQFTTQLDTVQYSFYGLMKQFYGLGGAADAAADWNQQMLGTLESYGAELGNFRYYLAGGTYHTIMRSPQFYTEHSPGIFYSEWLSAMLRNRGGTNGTGGGAWQDAACPDCLAPVPCP